MRRTLQFLSLHGIGDVCLSIRRALLRNLGILLREHGVFHDGSPRVGRENKHIQFRVETFAVLNGLFFGFEQTSREMPPYQGDLLILMCKIHEHPLLTVGLEGEVLRIRIDWPSRDLGLD